MRVEKQMNNGIGTSERRLACAFVLSLLVACMLAVAPVYAFAEEVAEGAVETDASNVVDGSADENGVDELLEVDESDADASAQDAAATGDGDTGDGTATEPMDNGADNGALDAVDASSADEIPESNPSEQVASTEEPVQVDEAAEPTPSNETNESATAVPEESDGVQVSNDAQEEPETTTAITATSATVAKAAVPATKAPAASTTATAKAKAKAKLAPANIKAGWYSIKTALNSAFYIQAKGSKSKNGTPIILKKYNGATGQAFKIVKVGYYYRIMCGTGYKSRIHVAANGKVSLVRTGSYNTLFTLMQEGSNKYRLVNLATGTALAISNNKAGTGVSLVAQKSVNGSKS